MYNKINIGESKMPPANKNDWWYDLNTGELKRFTGGNWSSVMRGNTSDSNYISVPKLYEIPNDQILVFTPKLNTNYINMYSEDGIRIDSVESDESIGARIYTFNTELTRFRQQVCELIISSDDDIIVVLPSSISDVEYGGIQVSNDYGAAGNVTLIFTNTNRAGIATSGIRCTEYTWDINNVQLVFYTHSVANCSSGWIVDSENNESISDILVYVQPSLVEEYKKKSAFINHTINKIS